MKTAHFIVLLIFIITASSLLAACAGMYGEDTFKLPDTQPCNRVTRYVPGDKVYYTFWAAGLGMLVTVAHWRKEIGPGYLMPIFIPTALAEGLSSSATDTLINLICWIPLEVYEGVTGETWKYPYMPFTLALHDLDEM